MFEDLNPSLPEDPRRAGPLESPNQDELDHPRSQGDTDELEDWKAALRSDFESWLETIDQIPKPVLGELEEHDTPDLYSFHEQLAVANTEARKSNRRTAEAFSQWGETLARFESQLAPLRESAAQLAVVQSKDNELPRAYCLVQIEFLDRMRRLAKAFESAPQKKGWWLVNDVAWRQAWETQRQGFGILLSHMEELLKKEDVTRIEAEGQPFDPTTMTAVAAVPDEEHPAQTVLEEVAPGYRRRGELLRPAQVKVSVRGGAK